MHFLKSYYPQMHIVTLLPRTYEYSKPIDIKLVVFSSSHLYHCWRFYPAHRVSPVVYICMHVHFYVPWIYTSDYSNKHCQINAESDIITPKCYYFSLTLHILRVKKTIPVCYTSVFRKVNRLEYWPLFKGIYWFGKKIV